MKAFSFSCYSLSDERVFFRLSHEGRWNVEMITRKAASYHENTKVRKHERRGVVNVLILFDIDRI